MGLGYALSEDFPADDTGRPIPTTLKGLGIIRPKDMPEVETILVECPQPNAPYGVKGVGEIGLVPTAGAVAACLHEIDGGWRTRLVVLPDAGPRLDGIATAILRDLRPASTPAPLFDVERGTAALADRARRRASDVSRRWGRWDLEVLRGR
jgi:hypothetical protein